jgi:hypothetical protein
MVQVETRFNRDSYMGILENLMLPSVIRTYANFVFQQDNCPVHTVQRVTAWFQNHNVTVSNWPNRSLDLNPIENMWGLLVNKLQQQRIICQKREKILNAVSDAWRTLHPDYFRNLCFSMPTRLT